MGKCVRWKEKIRRKLALSCHLEEESEENETHEFKDHGLELKKAEEVKEYEERIKWGDSDDYLIPLQPILRKIHSAYYEAYDRQNSMIPHAKTIVPHVRRKTLQRVNILFTGVETTSIRRRAVKPPPIKNGRRRRRCLFKARRKPSPPEVVGLNRLGVLTVCCVYVLIKFAPFRKMDFNSL